MVYDSNYCIFYLSNIKMQTNENYPSSFDNCASVISRNRKDAPQIMEKANFQASISECINNQPHQATGQSQMKLLQKV